MNGMLAFGCRVFQTAFRIALPFLPYREPEILNACSELGSVSKNSILGCVREEDAGCCVDYLEEEMPAAKRHAHRNRLSTQ